MTDWKTTLIKGMLTAGLIAIANGGVSTVKDLATVIGLAVLGALIWLAEVDNQGQGG